MPTTPYVIRDPVRGSFHFLRYYPLTQRWEPDRVISGEIRNARMRLYHLVNTPLEPAPTHYAEYQYATVADDATLTLMYELRDPSIVNDFSDIRMAGAGLHRDYVRDTADPPTEDRSFRERRTATLESVEPPEDAEEEMTPLQRAAQILLGAGNHTLPAPLTIPRTPLWNDWHSPLPRIRRTDRSLLASLLRYQSDSTQGWGGDATDPGVAQGGEVIWDRMVNPDLAVEAPQGIRRNIADAVIRDAISQKATCPISMDPISQETAACVAPCYHVFCRESIAQWLERETTCPTCREPCRM